MNRLVQPLYGFSVWVVLTDVSKPRRAVVPTATTRFFPSIPRLTMRAHSSLMVSSSLSTLCLLKSSTSTSRKVPKPMCKVKNAMSIPLISRRFNKFFEKCNPAVGTATAPSSEA